VSSRWDADNGRKKNEKRKRKEATKEQPEEPERAREKERGSRGEAGRRLQHAEGSKEGAVGIRNGLRNQMG